MELTRVVSGMCSTKQSMIAIVLDLIISIKELRDSANNAHTSTKDTGSFDAP